MKRKLIYILGIALLSSYSCQKSQLTQISPTSFNADGSAFANQSRINSQVLGLYSNLRSGQLYGGRFEIYNDVKGDNWLNSTGNSITAYQTWTETVTTVSSEVLNLWSQCYFTINNCNLFIDGMATVPTSVVSATLNAQYVAEAKFVRALAYFALMDMYCVPFSSGSSPGVPLRLTGLSTFGNYNLAPATVTACYGQIIADLNAAEAGLPLTNGDNVSRATKNAAVAFKTRIYLAEGAYSSVITEANKIVSATAPFNAAASGGVNYALQPSIASVFASPYVTKESIFSVPFNTQETPGTQNQIATYFNNIGATEYYLNTSSTLFTDPLWGANDARRGFITSNSKGKSLTKWSAPSPYTDWVCTMRYSEVLLNLAEARSAVNGAADLQAVALLNAVRQRSDATVTFATATQAQILEERNIEFLGEGLRWFDFLRLGLPIPAKGTVPAIPVNGYGVGSYIWPMSGNEQQYNTSIGR